MADTQRPELSSAFDDMLARSKKRFDDLYRGAATPGGSGAGTKASLGCREDRRPLGKRFCHARLTRFARSAPA